MQTSIDLRLARHGALVLLCGLLVGFVITRLPNRGAGDAAHLVGLIGGFGMIALSALWPRLNLNRFWSGAGAWVTVACMYANWLGCVFLAMGSGAAAAGSSVPASPLPWARAAGILLSAAIWMSLLSISIILLGLFSRGAPAAGRAAAAPGLDPAQ